MKKILVLTIIISALSIYGMSFAEKNKPYEEIGLEQLLDMRKSSNPPVVIDSRGGKYFDGEMIEGAVHLSVKDTNKENLDKIIPSRNDKVVFYCSNVDCPASGLAAYKAAYAGYKNIYKYPEGIEEWKEKGLPLSKIKL